MPSLSAAGTSMNCTSIFPLGIIPLIPSLACFHPRRDRTSWPSPYDGESRARPYQTSSSDGQASLILVLQA